jgi:PRTRC genetic system protein F
MQPAHWTGNVTDSIRNCLQSFASFQQVSVQLHYTDDVERHHEHGLDVNHWKRQFQVPLSTRMGAIWFTHGPPSWHVVGRILTGLEKALPGLGQTVLCLLHDVAKATLGVLAPSDVFGWACHLYWQGEDNENLAFEQADERENVFRRAEFEKHIPAWAFYPKPLADLDRLEAPPMKHKRDRWLVGKILTAAQDLKARAAKLNLQNDVGWLEYPSNLAAPFVLRWSEDDVTARVLDDAYEYECQNGETVMDVAFLHLFPWGDTDALRQALGALPEFLQVLQLLERFLILLTEPHEPTVNRCR